MLSLVYRTYLPCGLWLLQVRLSHDAVFMMLWLHATVSVGSIVCSCVVCVVCYVVCLRDRCGILILTTTSVQRPMKYTMLSVERGTKAEHIKSTMTCHEEKIETGRWQLPTKTYVQCTVKDQSYCNWIASKCAHDVEAWRMTICHLWRSRWVDRYHTILLHE